MNQYIEFFGNHPFLFGSLGLTIGAILYLEFQRAASAGQALSITAATRLQNDGNAQFIDIRDSAHFRSGHLIGAKNIPLKELSAGIDKFPGKKDAPLIVYCENGLRATKACSILRKAGFGETYLLSGGLAAWEKANLPIVGK